MFGSGNTVIYIDRKNIRVGRVSGNQVKNEQVFAEDWQVDKLGEIFQEIKDVFSSSVYVILGDDLSYVLYEKIKLKKDELLADALHQVVAERVPEDIENLHWHHRVLEKTAEETTVQISAFVTEVYEQITEALENVGVKVLRIETLSLSLASQVKNLKESMLLVYKGYSNLAIVVNKSSVIGSESLNTSDPKKEIKELMIFVREKYGMPVKDVKQKDLHPMVGVVKIQDKVEIIKKKKTKIEESKSEEPKEKNPSNKNLLMLISIPILGLTLLALLSFRGWLPEKFNTLQPRAKLAAEIVVEEIVENTPSPTPSPTPVDLSQYSVQVLNGSGAVGVAGEIEETLAAEGFVDFETSNADNYDYEKTIVQIKSDLPEQIFADIDRALNSDYEVELSEEVLTEESEYDVMVIVGIKREE